MFPLPTRSVQVVACGFSFLALLSLTTQSDSDFFRLPCVIAVFDVFLVTLMLRLMDELKDLDIDRALFSQRPVPSGRVLPSDIRTSLGAVITVYIVINMAVPSILTSALILLGYSLLMFAHFFSRDKLRKSLILSLVSHNPVVGLMLMHLAWGFVVTRGPDSGLSIIREIIPGGIMYWCVLASWELSRKIRSAEEETAYVTYSKVLGTHGAVLITATLQTIAFGIGLYLADTVSASPLYYVLLSAGYILILATHIRFLVSRSPRTNRLRQATEVYAGVIFLAQLAEYCARLLLEVSHA
jgi:4-hydroxybenzoate polyprenyltransferase